MKLTDRYSAVDFERRTRPLFAQFDAIIGHVLDDKFTDSHILVYEHARPTFKELFPQSSPTPPRLYDCDNLCAEEEEVLQVLNVLEDSRMLHIVGDVGVGKTTFLKHLIDAHFKNQPFGPLLPIYSDWRAFTAPDRDPLPAIYHHFITDVYSAIERHLTPQQLIDLDDSIFHTAKMFARDRTALLRIRTSAKRDYHIAQSITTALKEAPLDLACERLNKLSEPNRNAIVIIVDNIDQLRPSVLDHLRQFLIEIQYKTVPLLIVAMRDHTNVRGFSNYLRDATIPRWKMRLRAPNVRELLRRRFDHFFPPDAKQPAPQIIQGPFAVTLSTSQSRHLCRTLLESPFLNADVYEFLFLWCNHSIRDLFRTLQLILSSPSLEGFDAQTTILGKKGSGLTIDDCITALGLRQYLMFFPDHSPLFNPYSAGQDNGSSDCLVGIRLLQFLGSRNGLLVRVAQLKSFFENWGYSKEAVRGQLEAMVRKDILWTDTGSPEDFEDGSNVRLSYRGSLYNGRIVRRAIFNYMMSFDVSPPTEHHPVGAHHRARFSAELETFANCALPIDAEELTGRVLGLADVLRRAEIKEIADLRGRQVLAAFKKEVVPKSIGLVVVDGLGRLFRRILDEGGEDVRVTVPSTATLERVAAVKEEYRRGVVELEA